VEYYSNGIFLPVWLRIICALPCFLYVNCRATVNLVIVSWASCGHTRASTCCQVVQIGSSQMEAMSCGWKGNRRSGVIFALHYRLVRFIHLRAQGWSNRDNRPAYTSVWRNGRAFAHNPKGRGFKSRPVSFQITPLGKSFTPMPLSPSSMIWYGPMGSDALRLGR